MPGPIEMPPLKHGTAELEPSARLHHVTAGSGARTIVLLHGFPQTWWEWRCVIPALVQAGYRVVAPDYRGAGGSSKPLGGYDKRTMAADIHVLLRNHLGIDGPVTMVGHDIGMMVAYAFASSFPESTERLVLAEAPLPGTTVYDRMVATPHLTNMRLWHFFFHNAPNSFAEALTVGRERLYIREFYHDLGFDPEAIGPEDLDRYADSFKAPGAMRAGFELYRAFDRDAEDNRAALRRHGRLTMPVLGLGGSSSFFAPVAEEMLREVAENVTTAEIPSSGHWIAEENPGAVLKSLLGFIGSPA